MCIALNDGLEQQPRQRLRPYLTRTIGTAHDGLDTGAAGWPWTGWRACYTPAWLRLAGLSDTADRLETAAEITDAGEPDPRAGRSWRPPAARRAPPAPGRSGPPCPPGWAAAVAAGVAGREAAWACAGAAAWAAARIGIGDVAGDRARAAARAAAGDAAAIAVRQSRTSACHAGARATAQAALAPTLERLCRLGADPA